MGYWKEYALKIDERGFDDIDKHICSECVEDEFLKNWIEENSIEIGECDYCHRIHNIVPMEDIMDEVIMKTIRKYYENAEGNMHWDNEEDEYWGITYDTEDVVNNFAEQISSNQQVIDDIINAIHDITWCKYDPYGMTEREVCEYSWESFSDTVKYKNRYFFLQECDDEYNEKYSPLSILSIIAENAKKLGIIKTLPANFDFYRVRVFNNKNEVLLDDANLGAPPKESANTDRMSARGISAFYASDKLETSLKEVKNKEPNHNIIAFGKFNNVRELKYLDLTEIKSMSLPSVFDLNQYTLREAILFLKDLNDDLTRPIEKKFREIEYVPTQIFAEYFKFVENLDGIKYSSSKDHNESCYVLFFDNEQCIDDSKKDSWRQNCKLTLVGAKIIKRNEIRALDIINTLQIVDIAHFQKDECPDWWNNEDDIGLEITDSRTIEQGEIDSIMEYNFKNNIPLDEVIANDKKGKLKDELITVDNSYAKFRMLNNPSLESCIDKKLNKLNKHFNIFSQNWLFIFVDFIFDFNYIKSNQGLIISKLHDKYKIGFNKYILFNLTEIIVLDFEKRNLVNAEIYKYSDKKLSNNQIICTNIQ